MYKLIGCVIQITLLCQLTPLALATGNPCGNVFEVSIGPWDYADPKHHAKGSAGSGFDSRVHLVESRHFTEKVANLISGESGTEIMPDLHYTLGKFPNHYRALWSLIRFDRRLNGKLPNLGRDFPQKVECYFARAIQFKPEDAMVRQLFGTYYHLNKKYDQALEQYLAAEKNNDSAELLYNIGLLYTDMNQYENAAKYAEKAYAKNYHLPGLRDRLKKQGVIVNGLSNQ